MNLRLRTPIPLALAILLLAAAGSLANPLPEALLFTHVQPWVEGEPPTVTNCYEIVQYTTDEGSLEFDLYLRPFFGEPPYGARSMELTLEWDEDWTWLGYEIPHYGTGSVIVTGNQASVDIEWPGILQGEDQVLLMLRCFVQVTGYGQFGPVEDNVPVRADVFGPDPIEAWTVRAAAGVICDWCYTDCDFSFMCIPVAQTPVVNLQVVEGGDVETAVDFRVSYDYGGPPCPVNYSSSEEWLSLSLEVLSETEHRLSLTADSDGLAPGNYTAWLSGEAACVSCTQVNFEVLPTTGLQESSFSSVKSHY